MTTTPSTKRPTSPSLLPALLAAAATSALVACGGPLEPPFESPVEPQPSAPQPGVAKQRTRRMPAVPPPVAPVTEPSAAAVLAAELGELVFVPTSVGSGQSLAFELWNAGLAPLYLELDEALIIGSVVPAAGTLEGEFAAAVIEGYEPAVGLGPGQGMKIVVSFMPVAVGTRSARLELRSAGDGAVLLGVNLRGEGKDPRLCSWSLSTQKVDFGGLSAGEKRAVKITASNDELPGGATCAASARFMYGSDARFVLTGGQVFPAALQPGARIELEVTFVGTDEPGEYLGALLVEVTSGTPGEAVVPLGVRVVP